MPHQCLVRWHGISFDTGTAGARRVCPPIGEGEPPGTALGSDSEPGEIPWPKPPIARVTETSQAREYLSTHAAQNLWRGRGAVSVGTLSWFYRSNEKALASWVAL